MRHSSLLTLSFFLSFFCWQQGKKEEEEFSMGPLSILMLSVKNNALVGLVWFGRLLASVD